MFSYNIFHTSLTPTQSPVACSDYCRRSQHSRNGVIPRQSEHLKYRKKIGGRSCIVDPNWRAPPDSLDGGEQARRRPNVTPHFGPSGPSLWPFGPQMVALLPSPSANPKYQTCSTRVRTWTRVRTGVQFWWTQTRTRLSMTMTWTGKRPS